MTISFKSYDMNLSNKNNPHTPGSKRKGASVTTSEDNNRAMTVSNANFRALNQDLCKREQKIKELVERSGMIDHEIKRLEERFGMYEQEIYKVNLLIQQLRDNAPFHREIISYNGSIGQKESVEL